MRYLTSLLLLLLPATVVANTPDQADLLNVVRVRIVHEASVQVGKEIEARTINDYYVHNELVIPSGTLVIGKITRVTPIRRRARLDAMSHGDFTPLRTPEITFTDLRLADGRDIPISTDAASTASKTVRFLAHRSEHTSLLRREWASLMGRKNEAVKVVTAPGKKDRAEEYLYSQLPWHPQEVENGTVYDIHLRESVNVVAPTQVANSADQGIAKGTNLEARLITPLDSRKVKKNDPVSAIVTAPELDANRHIEIPQGSLLYGRIVDVRAARRFGRNGALRFNFERLRLPEGFEQRVNGVATAIDSAHGSELAIDAEGGVQPPSNKNVIAPLALTLLSASALHEDESPAAHAGIASNGFGLATRIVSITTKSNVFGGVIGGISAVRMIYSRFLAHGKDVSFDRGTGIEVDLGPTHAPMTRPDATSK